VLSRHKYNIHGRVGLVSDKMSVFWDDAPQKLTHSQKSYHQGVPGGKNLWNVRQFPQEYTVQRSRRRVISILAAART
jgi:hypothetical protein